MEAKEIVASYFGALGNGDMKKALSFLAADCRWTQPGDNMFAGVKNNLGEIIEMFEGMAQATRKTCK